MKALLYCFVLVLLYSCTSGPAEIPVDMSPAKIIQKAQEASDVNRYKLAVRYYDALLERYGSTAEYFCTAKYEIAFIHYKQKKYADARREFENLLVLYEAEGAEGLPPQFKILAEKVLSRIPKPRVRR